MPAHTSWSEGGTDKIEQARATIERCRETLGQNALIYRQNRDTYDDTPEQRHRALLRIAEIFEAAAEEMHDSLVKEAWAALPKKEVSA